MKYKCFNIYPMLGLQQAKLFHTAGTVITSCDAALVLTTHKGHFIMYLLMQKK